MFRFSLTHKILLAYFALVLFFVLVSCYSLYSQRRLRHFDQTQSQNLEVLQALQQLKTSFSLLEQARSRQAEDHSVADSHRKEFSRLLEGLAARVGESSSLREIIDGFQRLSELEAAARKTPLKKASADVDARSISSSLDLLIWEAKSELETGYSSIRILSKRAFHITLYLTILGLVVGLTSVLLFAVYLKKSIAKLDKAIRMIADGAFEYDPHVQSSDELGELARGLKTMASKFKNYEQLCLDASPLTRLPGNIAIERALLEKIRRNEKFALCYIDLDDFKAFNDTYGYAKGSEIIKVTGEILHETKRCCGRTDDFVGHIGGDDFVLITVPDCVQAVCENIIQEFDRVIPYFYSQEDREKGYIESVDRYGVARQFPRMTISIAVVSDVSRDIASPTEIAQIAAEIKDYVKALPGSNYLIDRRRGTRG